MIKQSQEDYLRAMYRAWERNNKIIHSVDIVTELKISKPAVSEMLKKLDKEGYIKMPPYSDITFTKKGLQTAKKLTFKHRVIEIFLRDVLDCPARDIHHEAHKLEHAFSDRAAKRLAKFLQHPQTCPGGKTIPKI